MADMEAASPLGMTSFWKTETLHVTAAEGSESESDSVLGTQFVQHYIIPSHTKTEEIQTLST